MRWRRRWRPNSARSNADAEQADHAQQPHVQLLLLDGVVPLVHVPRDHPRVAVAGAQHLRHAARHRDLGAPEGNLPRGQHHGLGEVQQPLPPDLDLHVAGSPVVRAVDVHHPQRAVHPQPHHGRVLRGAHHPHPVLVAQPRRQLLLQLRPVGVQHHHVHVVVVQDEVSAAHQAQQAAKVHPVLHAQLLQHWKRHQHHLPQLASSEIVEALDDALSRPVQRERARGDAQRDALRQPARAADPPFARRGGVPAGMLCRRMCRQRRLFAEPPGKVYGWLNGVAFHPGNCKRGFWLRHEPHRQCHHVRR
mmetsp:Transcript_4839/g.12128  ORF Transcript_4839/g.12128 Transcript_4839/m.12128 type:complete len:305 (+) Transcript_4839:141-1055(+)